MADASPLRIGTRGSPLALAQAHEVRDRLAAADPAVADEGAIEVMVIKTTGDKVFDRPLADIGGKGLFTKEINEALLAGLKRLGMADVATEILGTDQFLPAVGQGAIGITGRADDEKTSALLGRINHAPTMDRLTAERAMLAALDGSCRTPIAGLAEIEGDGGLTLRGLIARPDGSEVFETARSGPAADAEAMGRDAGEELRRRAGPGFFD